MKGAAAGWERSARVVPWCGLALALAAPVAPAPGGALSPLAPRDAPANLIFELNPADTKVNFTLGATLHTVHGNFQPLRGRIEYAGATGALRGEIIVDAASGTSGDASRDRKMHGEILESEKYPSISFRPDHAVGKLLTSGQSTLQIHGAFTLHGVEHELTAPVTVKLDGKNWTGSAHFAVPYVQWGLRNPSTFLLRVSKAVDIEFIATGTVTTADR